MDSPDDHLSFATTEELVQELQRRSVAMVIVWIPSVKDNSMQFGVAGHKATILGMLTCVRRTVLDSIDPRRRS